MRKEIAIFVIVIMTLTGNTLSTGQHSDKIVSCLNEWVSFNLKGLQIRNIWELSAQETEYAPEVEGFSTLKSSCAGVKELVAQEGGECQKQFNQITGQISIAPVAVIGTFKWVKPADVYQPIKDAISKLDC